MHTYWINMDQSVARREFMEQQFEHLDYQHTRIRAYTPETSPVIRKPVKCKRSAKDYACIASHFKTFQTALQDDQEIFMVMEDDTVIPFQVDWLQLIKTSPQNWDILQLFVINKRVVSRLYNNRYRRGKLWHPWSVKHFSAGIYLIKKVAAQHLINLFWHDGTLDFSQLTYPAVIDEVLYRPVKTYSLTYPAFFSNIDLGSTVHPDHVERHAQCVSKILSIQQNGDMPSFIHPIMFDVSSSNTFTSNPFSAKTWPFSLASVFSRTT